METVSYIVPNISCKHCTHTIESELSDLEGVRSVRAEEDTKRVTVSFEEPADEEQIKALLAEINYPIVGGTAGRTGD